MGKLNEIQEQTTQSWGDNSFTTKITNNTVEFDSTKDSFTFKDEVNVPSLTINGQASQPFTSEEKTKLSQVTTPMNIKGRVDSASELPTEDVRVGDVYLVGESGSETFEEYVCTEISGSPEQPVWENLGHVKTQPDWNQNNNNAEDFIKNRTHYVETGFATLMEDTFTDPYVEGIVYSVNALTSDFEMEEGKTYRITMLGQEYILEAIETEDFPIPHVVYGDIEENPENPTPGSFLISANYRGFTAAVASETEITSIDIKIEGMEETVHQLDDKYISDNIARATDIPSPAFNIDKTKYNIYPTFTNTTNEIKSTLQQSLIACAPAAANCVFDGGTNVFLGSAVYGNKISGSVNVGISSNSNMEVSGNSNIAINSNGGANKVSGWGNLMMASGAAAITVGGNSNTVISSYGGYCAISDDEVGSILIGQSSSIKFQNGGYQKVCINGEYGSELNGDRATIICGGGKIGSGTSSVIFGSRSTGNTIYGSSNMIVGGGQSSISNIGTSESPNSTTMCNVICSGNGTSTITSGAGNNIIGSCGGTFQINGGTNNNIIGFTGSGTIQGNQYNMIIGGSGNVTIPSSVSNCIVIGAATSSPTESNTVYVPALNAVNGVKTNKMTIAGIDPADCFMHSEIIDASSDVSFSRTIASASSSKTDGYVEILYKVSSGVTCSAYINSTDVALTADGDWHKLERGCNPADGVEIHINNTSPVTDATMEVISKVYYI